MTTIPVTHYSDLLCVWAYVGQIRVDELQKQFGDKIEIDIRFCEVFGDTRSKFERQWGDRGGAAGYGAHVQTVVADFKDAPVHPDIWSRNAPASSMPCHLFLCAVRLLSDHESGVAGENHQLAWLASRALRKAFFQDLVDISLRHEQLQIAETLGLSLSDVEGHLDSGRAHALLSDDFARARETGVRMSPTIVLNEGRQILAGNVGYRVIEANVSEMLSSPESQASWC
jgi:predicted DsbA family dithiol-disulfide isomerase